jgi:hypothetical protein
MPAKLRAALMSAGVAALTALAVFGTATPAFAKSSTELTGPRTAQARHSFRLTVWVGDDAGAHAASARLQLRGAHGRYQWSGNWYRLRLSPRDPWEESYAFAVTENRRGTYTFRAVVTGGYATTGTVTVVVR